MAHVDDLCEPLDLKHIDRYVYFEKVRIAEGKKKSPRREQNELAHPQGFIIPDHRLTRDTTHH